MVRHFFFFSSRRRHTRLVSDWSSDVCSSDLGWAGTKQTSAVAAPFILVNSLAGLAAGFTMQSASLPSYVWILVPAVLVGGWLGAEYGSRRFANPLVRRILAVALALAGAKMILA